MHTRFGAAATALLLAATTGLAATGAARASGSHDPSARGAGKLVVTIESKASGVKLSETRIRPGRTIFRVKNAGGPNGLMQLLRLKPGYSLVDAFSDFAAAFPPDKSTPADVTAVRRLDKNVVFYGGMETPHQPGKVNSWAVEVDVPSTYYVVNLDASALTTLTVRGHHQKRSLPRPTGTINAVSRPGGGNAFKPGKHDAARGWMRTANRAHEPHMALLHHVKKHTTKPQVLQDLQSRAPKHFLDGSTQTGVISPHRAFVWSYGLPQGRYFVTCLFPSKRDGIPDAFRGMVSLFDLG